MAKSLVWASYVAVMAMVMFILVGTCSGSVRSIGKVNPGFQGSQMTFIDNDGLFLLSNNSNFAFGFTTTKDVTLFLLVVVHRSSTRIIWTANRGARVVNSDKFVFEKNGNVYLASGNGKVWSTNTAEKGATLLELRDSGNLVLVGEDGTAIWESFSNPTDTLLSGQEFVNGMRLVSEPSASNLSNTLQVESGNVILKAGFPTPQPYWTIGKETRKTVNKVGEDINSASLVSNSWKFFDQKGGLLSQIIFTENVDANITWAAVLGSDGLITFYNLDSSGSNGAEQTKIPENACSTPEPCDSYNVCYSDDRCQCPAVLSSHPYCKPEAVPTCKGNSSSGSNDQVQLIDVGEKLNYFALGFVPASSKSDLNVCKESCLNNCSCLALFFEASSGNCFLFDQIGSLQRSEDSAGFVSYIKVPIDERTGSNGDGGSSGGSHVAIIVVVIVVGTILVIAGLIYFAFRYRRGRRRAPEPLDETSEEDNFLENLSGMPVRFTYKELEDATNNFNMKLGQGGFGSVYQGILKDGSRIAVKKLESIGQGKKEFRAEVSIIGSIHHVHLVRLKGFCSEGTHRMLAYEYMANGSLEKWIFKRSKEDPMLDWNTRFNIAVGTAKGLAYLHEDCDVKIVHCDIKPENVLLDDNYQAKVSDFGLAKLMNREQSNVFTTMRGTRGYLAPEWITSYAISEKSDVYSFGMLLLELIGGRKNYDPSESSEKAHFPTYAFKMIEEQKLSDIYDPKLKIDDEDERVLIAIKVALWCIQEDMYLRPSMSKVVQMLEGISVVPQPPNSSQMGSRLFSNFYKTLSEGGSSSGDGNSDAYLSNIQLSGPR